jgi:hypothetical protein
MEDSGILYINNLNIVGDLNIVLFSDEVWGGTSGAGNTDIYYMELFSSKNLIDIKPAKLIPTWQNGHCGQEEIARRLYRVLVSEDLLSDASLYRSWVELPYVFDHAPVIFQLDLPPICKAYTFKLNVQWLKDQDFVDLVYKIWKDLVFQSEGGKQHSIVWKLKILKSQTQLCIKRN